MIVAKSASAVRAFRLVERRTLEQAYDARSAQTQVVQQSMGILGRLARRNVLDLHRSGPATKLGDKVEGVAETCSPKGMTFAL